MSGEDLRPLKKLAIWSLIVAAGLISAFVSFLSLVSVWIGFSEIHRAGSWLPVTGGILIFLLTLWLYIRAAGALRRHLKSPDLFEL